MAECRRGGNGCGFFVFVWDERPPPKEILFPFEGVFFVGGGVYGEGSVAEAARGGDIHQVGGYDPPPSVVDATADWVRQYAAKGGRPGKGQTKRGADVVVVEPDAPPPLRGKGQTPAPKPSPKPSKVAKVAAAQPPHEALDVEALGASVATHVTDACQVLVEQAAATGVEGALAKGVGRPQVGLGEGRKGPGQHPACPGPGPHPGRQEGGGGGGDKGGPEGGPGGEAEGGGGGGPA